MNSERKGPAAGTAAGRKKAHKSFDNSAFAQRQRVLEALRKGPKSTLELRAKSDVLHPPGRVCELRKLGYRIITEWTQDFTPEGYPHRVAYYVLLGEAAPCA